MLKKPSDRAKSLTHRSVGTLSLVYLILLGLFSLLKLSGPFAAILAFEASYCVTMLLSKEKPVSDLLFMNVLLTGLLGASLYGVLSFIRLSFSYRLIVISLIQIVLVLFLDARKTVLIKKRVTILFILGLLLVAARLLISYFQHPQINFSAYYDDQLMYNLSRSLRGREWLGSYMNLTLAKGMFFPLWMAVCNLLSLPVLFANSILYVFSCFFLLQALSPILKNANARFVIFTYLLYNPVSFATEVIRLYRDSIYPALCLLVIAGFIGLFLRRNRAKDMLPFSLLGGIALLAAWNTREDSFWLLPFVISASVITAILILFEQRRFRLHFPLKRIATILAAFLLFFAGNASVSAMNQYHYGRYVLNDYTSSDFQGAYGALTRVRHENWIPDIPVPKDAREKIYAVSPAFLELRDELEIPRGGLLAKVNEDYYDYYGGWFFWSLRDAVAAKGYYETPLKAQEYYTRLASEVNAACDSGELDAVTGKRTTLASPFTPQYIPLLLRDIPAAAKYVIYLQNITFHDAFVEPSEKLDETVAYTHSFPVPENPSTIDRLTKETLSILLFAYEKVNPALTLLGLLCFVALLASLCTKYRPKLLAGHFQELLILTALFLLILLRIIMIAFVHCSSFPAITAMYLSSVYPILFVFSCLSIAMTLRYFVSIAKHGGVHLGNAQAKPAV